MLDDWLVDVAMSRLTRGGETLTLEPLPIAVLATLSRTPGEVVSAESLLDTCWQGVVSGDHPVHRAIAALRRALGDQASAPRYIETLRKRGYRLVAPVQVLSSEGERSHQGAWRGKSPFCGLEPFGRAHASVFFGRDAALATVLRQLARQCELGHPLLLLLGPSGSGKTSLVEAGLLPALLEGRSRVAGESASALQPCAAATCDLGAHEELGLWRALASALMDWDIDHRPLLSGYSIETLADALQHRPAGVIQALRLALDALGMPSRASPMLVLDRFEALFRSAPAGSADAFIAVLDDMVRSRALMAVVVCRNDFYPELARHAALMKGKAHGAHVDLEPASAEALAQMIRLPARAADLNYGRDASGLQRLDDRLCADAVQAQDALPLLQYALHALYMAREPGNELTWSAYEAMGGIEGAVGQRAEATLSSLPAAQQQALPTLLPRLVSLSNEAAAPTGRWVRMSELSAGAEGALVAALVEARLLVADSVAGVPGVRLAHEALLRRWPRVTQWIGQHRATLALRDELLPWVRRWLEGGKAATLLLPQGAMLWKAAGAGVAARSLFTNDEQAFVTGSQQRLKRQARTRVAASALAVLLACLAGLSAIRYAELAREASRRELQSQRLASFMLGDLAEQLRPIGKLNLLASISDQGVKLLGREGYEGEPANDVLQRAKALVMIGEVNSSSGQGRVNVAMDALHQAERVLHPLDRSPGLDADEYYKVLGANAFWLAQMAYDANDFTRATALMNRYREACERWLAAVPGSPSARLELSYAFSSLGSIAMRRGAWAEATASFEASLALKTGLLESKRDDPGLVDAIASAKLWLGRLALVRGAPRQALAHLDAAYAAKDALRIKHPREHARGYSAGIVAIHRAAALQAMRRNDEALKAMQEGVASLREAVRNDGTNQRWIAEQFAAESALLQLRVDLGLATTAEWQVLQRQLAEHRLDSLRDDYTWKKTRVRMEMIAAQLRAGTGEWQRVLDANVAVASALEALLAEFPHDAQARELEARRALLGIQAFGGMGGGLRLREWCDASEKALAPRVQSGQGGFVLEAWIKARTCLHGDAPDAASIQRLTEGGYVPQVLI